MNDKCALWFRQTVGREFRYINFMHESGVNIPMWVRRIRETGYMIGRVIIPHDGKAREISSGETRQQSFWNAGIRAEVQPKQQIMDGINAARVHLSRCVFDEENCKEGIECLELYRKKWDAQNSTFTNTPVHDQYSNGADAFRYAALDEREPVDVTQRRVKSLPSQAESDYNEFGW